jgi:propanol-preferring alcohol dehydrogenase
MMLMAPGQPLQLVSRRTPWPGTGELLLRVHACGVCRTDLHIVDRELPDPALPRVPGHEIVGVVEAVGPGVSRFREGGPGRSSLARRRLRDLPFLPGAA